jgi:hypothetical protein
MRFGLESGIDLSSRLEESRARGVNEMKNALLVGIEDGMPACVKRFDPNGM